MNKTALKLSLLIYSGSWLAMSATCTETLKPSMDFIKEASPAEFGEALLKHDFNFEKHKGYSILKDILASDISNKRKVELKKAFESALIKSLDNRAVLTAFIETGGDPQFTDTQGRTIMFHAITLGDLDLIKLLIRHGVDARHKDQFGFTPIDYTKSILAQIKLFSNEGAEQLKKLGFNAAQIQALRNNSKKPKLSATECDVIIKLLESSKQ